MKKLEIVKIDNYDYELKDNEKIYYFNLEFMDIDKLPQVGDDIYINESLLDKNYQEYSNSYTFGKVNSKYGREKTIEKDTIVLKRGEEKIYLQRLYG